jgi:DNA (cytosine-5)-methyltransferase 1
MIDYVWSRVLGQEIAGQVEINPYCQALLTERWPDVPKAQDLKELTENDPFGTVDVVAGGIPCQPFSSAGKRRGTDDDRHLWPSAFALVQRRKPTWVLIENVARFVTVALDLVQADLESAGYQSQAYVLPACAIGAPHIRKRVFILAHATSCRLEVSKEATQLSMQPGSSGTRMAHSDGDRQWNGQKQPQHLTQCDREANTCTDGTQGTLASIRSQQCDEHTASPGDGQSQSGMGRELNGLTAWMDRTQWPALPGKPQYEWEPPRTVARKVPHHDARLEALGNTIVPQQIYPFLKGIVEYERGGI